MDVLHSDRCEILGLIAVITALQEIISAFPNEESLKEKTITIYSDSLTAIEYTKKTLSIQPPQCSWTTLMQS